MARPDFVHQMIRRERRMRECWKALQFLLVTSGIVSFVTWAATWQR